MNDLTNKIFGYFKVLALANRNHKGSSWLCRCICGKELIVSESNLLGTKTRKPSKSCGCKQYSQNGLVGKHLRIYGIWHLMNSRCYNPKADNYDRYGGKGVTVCNEWRNSFQSFLKWALSNGYHDKLTIDRIYSAKPYEPSNCRWADYFTQEQNRGMQKNNTTGYKGVTYYPKYGYRANMKRYGIRKESKYFPTLQEAVRERIRFEHEALELKKAI
jgi:hypothetical protein